MRGLRIWLALIVISLGAPAYACAVAPVPGAATPLPATGAPDLALASRAILVEVNARRCAHGLPPLTDSLPLAEVSLDHSEWIARTGTISHQSTAPGREGLRERLVASGVSYSTGAENIAMIGAYASGGASFYIEGRCVFRSTETGEIIPRHSYASMAATFVENWMNSPGHRANILKETLRRAGAGLALDPKAGHCGRLYATQIFVG